MVLCEGPRTAVSVTVNTTSAPTASAQTFCSGATVADLVATGTSLQWYTASTGGSALATSTTLSSGTYYVSQTLNSCESTRTSVFVTIYNTPLAPTASAQTFCTGATVANLVATPGVAARFSVAAYRWYTVNTGGSALSTSTALVTGTYYVAQVNGTCEGPRTTVSVTVNTTSAPTASAQTFCSGATVADLVATGTSLKWYTASTGGSALATSVTLSSGTYYVSQTLNSCESTRTSVSITVNTTPLAPTASAQTFCTGATVANLVATPGLAGRLSVAPYRWYTLSTGGSALSTSTALVTGTYYVSQLVNLCEGPRTAVAVTVNTTSAPTASAQTFCSGATVADLVATGTSLQWYAASTGGSALATSATLTSGTYYVSQTLNSCESTRTSVVVTVDAMAIAGTISGATTVTSLTNSTILTLSGYTGSIQWQSSNALSGTYTNIGGATAATYTATNLTATTYYRAVVSNGVCSPEISSPATITVSLINPNLSKVIDSQCGTTLSAINTLIYANAISGASAYRFKVTNGATTEIIEPTSGRGVRLTSLLGGTLYNTTYTISVAVKKNNVWGEYGEECTVTTPESPAKIQEAQCGTTLAGLNSPIFSIAKYGATGYRFEITNGGTVYTYDSVKNYFRLPEVNGPLAKYGESFSIRVSIQLYGLWQPYGASCTINTPASPIKVQDAQCGTTLAGLNSPIIATAGSYADTTGYRFEVTSGTNVYIYDSVKNYFNLTQLNVPAVQYGASYSIRVSIKLYGIWQPYGTSCTINTPLAPLTQLQASQCGITLNSTNTTLLYANSIAVAQKYRFEVSLGANVYTYDTASSSVRSFKMTTVPGLTLVAGTTYGIRVAIMANGQWQPYGASCNVTTYGVAPVILKTAVEPVSFNVMASPSPFTENFTLRLTTATEDKVTVMVYDMTGKLMEKKEVVPSELSELQVGNDFSSGVYNVIVSQGENVKTIRVIKR